MDVVIYIDNKKIFKMRNFLFAIDASTKEVIVSESPKKGTAVHFIERISRNDNYLLYSAVETLTAITHTANFDTSIFEAMDKVCQMIYNKNKTLAQ